MIAKYKVLFSIFIIWLFNISGIIGILSPYQDWFLGLTPLNLFLYFVLIFWNLSNSSSKFFLAVSIPFVIGFVTEFLGTNYGWFFGEYTYGENLGTKIGGVPIIICINWAVLTIITADLSQFISRNIWVKSFLGGFLMMLLDIIIEVSAPRFDFWEFLGGDVPIKNYVAWLVISFVAHLLYNQFNIKSNKIISVNIFIAITVFFASFLIF